MKIFVYGTLLRGFSNHRLLKASKFVSETMITYSGRMVNTGAFPAIVDDPKVVYTLYGEVFEVDDETLARLDSLEGHPRWYRRVKITTHDGHEVEFYAMREKSHEARLPTVESGSWRRETGNYLESSQFAVLRGPVQEPEYPEDCTTIPIDNAAIDALNASVGLNDMDEEDEPEGDEDCETPAAASPMASTGPLEPHPELTAAEPIDDEKLAQDTVKTLLDAGYTLGSGADPYSLKRGRVMVVITVDD